MLVSGAGEIVVRHWEGHHLRLRLVEGEGEARGLLWPEVGSTQRALNHIRMGPGHRTIPLIHPESEAVYYVVEGRGELQDLDEGRRWRIEGGKVALVTPATRYRFEAETELVVVGGPCPVDRSLYRRTRGG
jgi:mannose-6-phosphate isomerase-like protein (cupin superfamily)